MLQTREFEAALDSLCARLEPAAFSDKVTSSAPEFALELIVAGNPQAGQTLLNGLRKWLAGASTVVLCDPYFLHFRPSKMFTDQTAYINAVSRIFPKSVTEIDLYVTGFTSTVKTEMLRSLKEGRSVRLFDTEGLHDRFILKDRYEGKVIGTSFGGLGNKFFFTENIPSDDTVEIRKELQRLAPFPTQLNRGGNTP